MIRTVDVYRSIFDVLSNCYSQLSSIPTNQLHLIDKLRPQIGSIVVTIIHITLFGILEATCRCDKFSTMSW